MLICRFGILVTAFCLVLPWLAIPARAAGHLYNIVALDVLPVPPGADPFGVQSYAYAINNQGVVVGESTLNTSGNIGQTRPVLWDGSGEPQELWDDQVFGGKGLGINSAGFVVGRYGSGSGTPLPGPGIPGGGAFIWNPTTREFKDLGDLGGARVEATGINDAGQVVGSSEMPWVFEINGVPTILPVPRAFIWDEDNGMQDLGTLDGGASRGTAINSQGKVVGWSSLLSNGIDQAFIWDSQHGMQALTTQSSRAFAINDQGQVVGVLLGDGVTTPPAAFIWDALHGIRPLLTDAEAADLGFRFLPRGINASGKVVGHGEMIGGQSHAIVWQDGVGPKLLRDLLPTDSGWEPWFAFSVNDVGQIVGYGRLNNEVRAFVATPIPEPSTVALAAFAIVCIFSALRRSCVASPN